MTTTQVREAAMRGLLTPAEFAKAMAAAETPAPAPRRRRKPRVMVK